MKNSLFIIALSFALFITNFTFSQISLPPSGDNQKCSVTQWMGFASVTINYSSPNVHTPDGTDRTGHIWGELVPYGFSNQNFGLSNASNPSPWRAGANENTTITFSHDVNIEGKPLKAGTYGFFIAAAEGNKPWTLIFSKNSTAWGSYFYKPSEEALRVDIIPQKSEYTEWLTYNFSNRELSTCTAELRWENMRIPFIISIDNPHQLYIDNIRKRITGLKRL